LTLISALLKKIKGRMWSFIEYHSVFEVSKM